jgi:hypothetical protein
MSEHQPFLYSDNAAAAEKNPQAPRDQPYYGAQRRNRILSYVAVVAGTSLVWILVIMLLGPGSPTPAHNASSSSSAPSHMESSHESTHKSSSSHESTHKSSSSHQAPPDRFNITTNARLLSCGNSPLEAREAGCIYDILLNNWVPAPCADQEWVDEYMDDESWGGYEDEAMTRRLTVAEMSERAFYYTSIRDHVNHCAIMWKKQFTVLYEVRKHFDTVISSPGHTEHCAQYLMDIADANFTHPTRTEMGFAGCWVRD